MNTSWLKPRGYRHLDAPVGASFAAKIIFPVFVAKHSWLPLIHYVKREKRYKKKKGETKGETCYKDRDIMFASHRDACILSKYAFDLNSLLEQHYALTGLGDNVIAYRKLGRGNYDFFPLTY